MKSVSLRASTAIALVLGATSAYAQVQQKEQNPGPADKQVQTQERAPDAGAKAAQDRAEQKGNAAERANEPKEKSTQKKAEPTEKSTKGTAQKNTEPQEKATKGTAQKNTEPQEKATKGNAQNSGDKPAANKAAEKTPDGKATKAATEPRAKLSDQQQTRVRETLLKEKVERTNVQFNVTIGTRVPRHVHLAPLPAVVFEIVPEYRNYRYVMVRDDIVIIDPNSYEIVYVLPARSNTAHGGGSLMLNDEQMSFVLRNIDLKSDSRLGIGGLTVGAHVARDNSLREFPLMVVEKLPELRSYRYLVHENDVAIVDSRDATIVIVTPVQR